MVIAHQQDMIIWSQLQCVELGRHVTEKFEGQCQNAEGSFRIESRSLWRNEVFRSYDKKVGAGGAVTISGRCQVDAKLFGSRFVVRFVSFPTSFIRGCEISQRYKWLELR